jgi:RTX calcium-binding nonapeptide repeat (4 copies)
MRRGGRASLAVLATATAAALAPAGASAVTVTAIITSQGTTYEVNLDDELGGRNEVGLATVTPAGGVPDLVIGDLFAGIPDPIPSFCQRVDIETIRCPLNMVSVVEGNLGPGNDVWGMSTIEDVDMAALRLARAYMGPGNDRAVGGEVRSQLHGGKGRDLLAGGPERDLLYGDAGNDFMVGKGGPDVFRCGAGIKDRFNDGKGKDLVDVGACELRVHSLF